MLSGIGGILKTALLFPGQGAQAVGMAAELVERSPIARECFELANSVLGFDLLRLCLEGPQEELNRTDHAQPALYVHSMAALRDLEAQRPGLWDDVVYVAGLSLGEYTAVAAAGGISFEDGLRLVRARGQAMQAAADRVDSGMASILGLERPVVEELCQSVSSDEAFVRPANYLCPGNIAVSGHIAALDAVEGPAQRAGAMRVVRLPVAGAFHTPLMQPAVAQLQAALQGVAFTPTRVPVVSNVDARPHSDPDEIRGLLSRQVVEPVLWEDGLRWMLSQGVEQSLEIGTGRVLAGLQKRIDRKTPCESYG
ncbi:MAG: [acyl-carrier-protein] S-malonyltransferase [Planctomycetota bacterium]|nr:MAG: [acyl-carrier-protein] S-malonyltransferase [Planctomycetota bacterium]